MWKANDNKSRYPWLGVSRPLAANTTHAGPAKNSLNKVSTPPLGRGSEEHTWPGTRPYSDQVQELDARSCDHLQAKSHSKGILRCQWYVIRPRANDGFNRRMLKALPLSYTSVIRESYEYTARIVQVLYECHRSDLLIPCINAAGMLMSHIICETRILPRVGLAKGHRSVSQVSHLWKTNYHETPPGRSRWRFPRRQDRKACSRTSGRVCEAGH